MRDLELVFLASLTLSEGAAMGSLGLGLSHQGTVTQLICTGELTSETGEIFRSAVDIALETFPSELHIDTSRLHTITPEGIVALLRAMWHCAETETVVRLIPGPILDDALTMAGIGWLFDDHYALHEPPAPDGDSQEPDRSLRRK